MKDELRLYCVNEGFDEEYLLSLIAAEKKLSRLKKPAKNSSRSPKCESNERHSGKEKAKGLPE